jgi:hypothetical protein
MYNRVGIPFAIGFVIVLIFALGYWLAKAAGWV